MKLVEPTMAYDRQIQAFRQEFLDAGSSNDGSSSLKRFDTTRQWLDYVEQFKSPETTPTGYVPATQYIYVRETDGKIVGMIQIRHTLTDGIRYAGHIGYSVCPSERRKGYATRMLEQTLPLCRALGLERVYIACAPENEGSRRTILNNGGVYEATAYWPERDRYLEQYRIDLPT